MAGPMDFIQEHPGLVAAGAAGLGLIVFASSRGGSGAPSVTPTPVTQSAPGPAYITSDQFNQALATYDSNIREYMSLLMMAQQPIPPQPPNPIPLPAPPPGGGFHGSPHPPHGPCGPNHHRDSAGNCVPDDLCINQPYECAVGYHWDVNQCRCVQY